MIVVSMMAARSAPRRLPAKIQLRLPNAIPRNAISAALLLRQILPSPRIGYGRYCYPLTMTGQASRFLLMCEALESTREELAVAAFEGLFAERGLPLSDPLRQWRMRCSTYQGSRSGGFISA